jgi:hypothetical protein
VATFAKIQDSEAGITERAITQDFDAAAIWPAMGESSGHRPDRSNLRGSQVPCRNSTDPTHGGFAPSG